MPEETRDKKLKGWVTGPAEPRVVKERLTPDRIVDVALQQMKEMGYESVSMRSIAKALDTGPASLYAHVSSREHLDQLVIDRISSSIEVEEADPERWEEQVKDFLTRMLQAYRDHPGSARATMGVVPTEVGSLRAAEALMAYCLAGGIQPQLAAWFCDLTALYVGAVAVEEGIWQERYAEALQPADWDKVSAELNTLFATLPTDRFPILSSMADVMTNGDGDDRQGFALDVLLLGLKALSART
jgi:AcrR family transcriptional regulator